MGQDPDAIRHDIEQTRARMGDTVEAIGYRTDVKSRAKDSISDRKDALMGKVDAIKGSVVGAKDSATSSVADAGSAIGEHTPSGEDVRATARRGKGLAEENPLGLAIGAAAAGFIAGLLFPATRTEQQKLGPIAEQVKDSVKETAGEAVEHGRQVVQETAEAAKEAATEARSRHAEELKASAQSSAEEVRTTIGS